MKKSSELRGSRYVFPTYKHTCGGRKTHTHSRPVGYVYARRACRRGTAVYCYFLIMKYSEAAAMLPRFNARRPHPLLFMFPVIGRKAVTINCLYHCTRDSPHATPPIHFNYSTFERAIPLRSLSLFCNLLYTPPGCVCVLCVYGK